MHASAAAQVCTVRPEERRPVVAAGRGFTDSGPCAPAERFAIHRNAAKVAANTSQPNQ